METKAIYYHQATTTEDSTRNFAHRRWKQTKAWKYGNYQNTGEEKTSNQGIREYHLTVHNQILNKNKQRAEITTYLSILTMNVNGLNFSIQRHCLANWIKREDVAICCLQETHLIYRNKQWLRLKVWKKDLPSQWPTQTLILDNIYFKLPLVKQDKEQHFILIKGAIYQKEIIIINLYAPNVHAPNFIKHTLKDLKIHIKHSGSRWF
jgi:hypothetical protein